METQELRTLKILEAVEQEDSPSQRDLARRLNVSLGLVNSFVKRLVNKGYVKITNIPKNRVRYLLTPKGAAEKTRLTYAYINYSFDFYRRSRKSLSQIFRKLSGEKAHQIVFYGATDLAEIAYISLQETDLDLAGVVDDEKMGKRFLGGRWIQGLDALAGITYDVVLITSIDSIDETKKMLTQQGGVPAEKIVSLPQ